MIWRLLESGRIRIILTKVPNASSGLHKAQIRWYSSRENADFPRRCWRRLWMFLSWLICIASRTSASSSSAVPVKLHALL
jgi:hypothetical protein